MINWRVAGVPDITSRTYVVSVRMPKVVRYVSKASAHEKNH